ncbi:unnamed protein product [Arctogadus glacialis]
MQARAKREDFEFGLALVKMPYCSANKQPARKKRALRLADVRKRNVIQPGTPTHQQPLLMHGLSVEQYRAVYNTIVEPSASKKRSSTPENKSTVLGRDLKYKLWMAVDRPKLEEVMAEDGRIEIRVAFDPLLHRPDMHTD